MGNIIRTKIFMEKIYHNIWNKAILDSEIIQEMESAKHRDPGFDINYVDYYMHWSLLMYAVFWKRIELIRYLLSDPDINVNHETSWGNTILHLLCNRGNMNSLLTLLLSRKDINVNIRNKYGYTGLHWAHYLGHEECVKELLFDARVDIFAHNYCEKSIYAMIMDQHHDRIDNMLRMVQYTSLIRIPNKALQHDIVRMIIEEYA